MSPSSHAPTGVAWPALTMALIAFAVVFATAGLGYGVPNSHRIESLLGGGPADPLILQQAAQQRTACDAQVRLQRSEQRLTGARSLVDNTCISDAPGRELNGPERVTAFRSHLLRGGLTDEGHTLKPLSNMRPSQLQFDPGFFLYGGAYLYSVGALILVGDLSGLAPIERQLANFALNPEGVANLYRSARFLSVIATALSLIVLASLARRWGGWWAAAFAVGAHGFTSLVWYASFIAKPHAWAAFWAILCFYLLVRFVEEQRLRWAVAAASAAMAVGSVYSAGYLVLAFPVMLFRAGDIATTVRSLSIAALVFLAVFFATNPYVIINFNAFAYTVWEQGTGYERTSISAARLLMGASGLATFLAPWLFVLGLAGWALMLRLGKRSCRRTAIALAAVAVPTVAFFVEVRFSLFWLWVLSLGFGLSIDALLARLSRHSSWLTKLAAAASLLLLVPSMTAAGLASYAAYRERPRPHALDLWARTSSFENMIVATSGTRLAPAPAYPVHRARTLDMAGLRCLPLVPDWIYLFRSSDGDAWAAAAEAAGYALQAELAPISTQTPFAPIGIGSYFNDTGYRLYRKTPGAIAPCLSEGARSPA